VDLNTTEKNWINLPEFVRNKALSETLTQEELEKDIEILWRIVIWFYPEYFTRSSKPRPVSLGIGNVGDIAENPPETARTKRNTQKISSKVIEGIIEEKEEEKEKDKEENNIDGIRKSSSKGKEKIRG